MIDAGYLALPVALVVTLYSTIASLLGGWQRLSVLVISARYGLATVPLLLLVSTSVLVSAFVTRDFSIRYVAENSNSAMPFEYTWVALYAGNSGSLLFIATVFAILSVIAVFNLAKRLPLTAPYITAFLALFLSFFLAVIVFLANPLEKLSVTPVDGQGINPLLVHFGMFIHPPMQMTGLVSVAIPFSIAMGTLIAGRGGHDDWVDIGRLWGMVSWLILTIGLMLGSWWAYTILGWGGYWAWDPVENSALMPWLAMTAFVHSIMVQKRRGMFRMWNIILITVAFTLAQMGMFINRGGPVPSVHSFAQSTMGWVFLIFMGLTLLGSLSAFAWRMKTLKSRGSLESLLSRESFFLLQNVLFLTVAFVTLWGTIYPVIADASQNVAITVGEPYFNIINGPILLTIIIIMGVGPLLPWRRTNLKNTARTLIYPVGVALVVAGTLLVSGVRHPLAVLALSMCAIVFTGIVHEWIRGTRSRHKKGENYLTAFVRLILGNRPRYGGHIVHLSIVMLAIGAIGSSFYSIQRDFTLYPGQKASLGKYTFQYIGLTKETHSDRVEMTAEFNVNTGNRNSYVMRPKRTFYPDFRIGATRAGIRSTPIEDFYLVPSEFGEGNRAVFRAYVNPMVWWMWASGPLLALGTLIAISPKRRQASLQNKVSSVTQMPGI